MSKLITFLFFTVLFLNSCDSISQVKVDTSVWSPNTGYEKKEYDSTMILVFEENFNDSIKLYNGKKHVKDLHIKTNKTVGVVPLFHKIEDIDPEREETFKVHFIEKDEIVAIELGKRYSYAYISRTDKGDYFVEYSNYERKYY